MQMRMNLLEILLREDRNGMSKIVQGYSLDYTKEGKSAKRQREIL